MARARAVWKIGQQKRIKFQVVRECERWDVDCRTVEIVISVLNTPLFCVYSVQYRVYRFFSFVYLLCHSSMD